MADQLKEIVRQEDAVLFIGSGVSTWSGLPTWPALIQKLSNFLDQQQLDSSLVRAEAVRNDLLQAASYGFDQLTVQQISEFLRSVCRVGQAAPHEIHRRLVTLGPKCFITTNYDSLLENAVQRWASDEAYRTVSNRHLIELAEIIHARANHFIFKPHGDINDIESVILTREQYRVLLPGGERHQALQSLQILLASRPVVYIGFGLRDPDFMLIRDLLANTYKGGIRDHYAVMPDVKRGEIEYWKRQYGIHLVSYRTTTLLDGTIDHSELLALLERIGFGPSSVYKSPDRHQDERERLLLPLMRHCARLSRFATLKTEFPLRVSRPATSRAREGFSEYDGIRVERFLDSGPERATLIGSPGAGKSYALQNCARRLAERFHANCLSEQASCDSFVPVLIDLKLYEGSFLQLIEKSLPPGVSFEAITTRFRPIFLIDAFNEMPRQFLESGAWEADLNQFLAAAATARIIIASRTQDVLEKFELPMFYLDELDEEFVRHELLTRHFEIHDRFEDELLSLLSKPLYFKLAINGEISLRSETRPKDLFGQILDRLIKDCRDRFKSPIDLVSPLSRIAFDAIDGGQEALPLSGVSKHISLQLQQDSIQDIDALAVINWLIAKNWFVSHSGARLAFFHQSITEYLAASELAKKYLENASILRDKMRWHRWDQALFLTVGLLPRKIQRRFVTDVLSLDFLFALSAIKFMETGSAAIVANALTELHARVKSGSLDFFQNMRTPLLSLPVAREHAPLLKRLISAGEFLGGNAVVLLFRLGLLSNEQLVDIFLAHRDSYNFCTSIARELGPRFTESEIPYILRTVDRYQRYVNKGEEFSDRQGFTPALAEMLSGVSSWSLHRWFIADVSIKRNVVRLEVLLDTLVDQKSSEALEVAAGLVLKGVRDAVFPFYIISHFAKEQLNWSFVCPGHLTQLLSFLEEPKTGPWVLNAIRKISQHRSDISTVVSKSAEKESSPVLRACLHWAANSDQERVFEALSEILQLPSEEITKSPLHCLAHLELNWRGREELFVSLLRMRCLPLAYALVQDEISPGGLEVGFIEIGPIHWWLDWLQEDDGSGDWWMFEDRLSRVFDKHLNPDAKAGFLCEFNDHSSCYRDILARSILFHRNDLSTDDFSTDAISFLMKPSTLNREHGALGTFLGKMATEKFVTETLLPARSKASRALKRSLEAVIEESGRRHGRRYLL